MLFKKYHNNLLKSGIIYHTKSHFKKTFKIYSKKNIDIKTFDKKFKKKSGKINMILKIEN